MCADVILKVRPDQRSRLYQKMDQVNGMECVPDQTLAIPYVPDQALNHQSFRGSPVIMRSSGSNGKCCFKKSMSTGTCNNNMVLSLIWRSLHVAHKWIGLAFDVHGAKKY